MAKGEGHLLIVGSKEADLILGVKWGMAIQEETIHK